MSAESLVEPDHFQLQLPPPRHVGITRGHEDGSSSTIWFPIAWQSDGSPRPMIPASEMQAEEDKHKSANIGHFVLGQMEIPLPPRRLEPFEAGNKLFAPDSWDKFGPSPTPDNKGIAN